MFYMFSTYPQLWTKLLTILKFEDFKGIICQVFFCKISKIFFIGISTFYIIRNYTYYPRLWTTLFIHLILARYNYKQNINSKFIHYSQTYKRISYIVERKYI